MHFIPSTLRLRHYVGLVFLLILISLPFTVPLYNPPITTPLPGLTPVRNPYGTCSVDYHFFYLRYELYGRDWRLSEREVKKIVKRVGATTGWSWDHLKNDDGVEEFWAKVNFSSIFLFPSFFSPFARLVMWLRGVIDELTGCEILLEFVVQFADCHAIGFGDCFEEEIWN